MRRIITSRFSLLPLAVAAGLLVQPAWAQRTGNPERDAEIDRLNAVRREAQARVAELTTELQKMRAHLHRSTAAAMNDPATRWYVIDKRGFATYCADWEDARDTAREADQAYPDIAPHACGWMSIADREGGAV